MPIIRNIAIPSNMMPNVETGPVLRRLMSTCDTARKNVINATVTTSATRRVPLLRNKNTAAKTGAAIAAKKYDLTSLAGPAPEQVEEEHQRRTSEALSRNQVFQAQQRNSAPVPTGFLATDSP